VGGLKKEKQKGRRKTKVLLLRGGKRVQEKKEKDPD